MAYFRRCSAARTAPPLADRGAGLLRNGNQDGRSSFTPPPSSIDKGCVKSQSICRVGSIACDLSQQSRVKLNLRARKFTAPLVPQEMLHRLDPFETVATGRFARQNSEPSRRSWRGSLPTKRRTLPFTSIGAAAVRPSLMASHIGRRSDFLIEGRMGSILAFPDTRIAYVCRLRSYNFSRASGALDWDRGYVRQAPYDRPHHA